MKDAANDSRHWGEDDLFFSCDCGCGDFWIKRDGGYNIILCIACGMNHTDVVYELPEK